jgi:hypothetical protein
MKWAQAVKEAQAALAAQPAGGRSAAAAASPTAEPSSLQQWSCQKCAQLNLADAEACSKCHLPRAAGTRAQQVLHDASVARADFRARKAVPKAVPKRRKASSAEVEQTAINKERQARIRRLEADLETNEPVQTGAATQGSQGGRVLPFPTRLALSLHVI